MPDAREFRSEVRSGRWRGPTSAKAAGLLQANVMLVPEAWAAEFLRFCVLNPKPAPLLAVTATGDPCPGSIAPGADLRTDVPAYRVYRDGELVAEPHDVSDWYRDDLVGFLLGCSFTFEQALLHAGVPLRHIARGTNVSMFRTTRLVARSGRFQGEMVVTMRPVPAHLVTRTVAVSSRYPIAHGAPVNIGEPGELGIRSLECPDYGDPCPVISGETPVFWACGVTAELAARRSGCPFFITHAPGHMFVTDVSHEEARGLRPLDRIVAAASKPAE